MDTVEPDTSDQKLSPFMAMEERLHEKVEKLQARVAKLENEQFGSRKAEQDNQKFKDQVKAGLKKSSESHISLEAKVKKLAGDLDDVLDDLADLRESGGSNVGHLATAPTAESWEASKQAADLIDSRTKAAIRTQVRQQELDDIASLSSIRASNEMQHAQAHNQADLAGTKGAAAADMTTPTAGHSPKERRQLGKSKGSEDDSSTSEDDVVMGGQEGTVIRDSQQNAQSVDYIPPLVDYDSSDSGSS